MHPAETHFPGQLNMQKNTNKLSHYNKLLHEEHKLAVNSVDQHATPEAKALFGGGKEFEIRDPSIMQRCSVHRVNVRFLCKKLKSQQPSHCQIIVASRHAQSPTPNGKVKAQND